MHLYLIKQSSHSLCASFFSETGILLDMEFQLFIDKFLLDRAPFCGATSTLCFGLWMTMLRIVFKDRVDSWSLALFLSLGRYDPQSHLRLSVPAIEPRSNFSTCSLTTYSGFITFGKPLSLKQSWIRLNLYARGKSFILNLFIDIGTISTLILVYLHTNTIPDHL